MQLLNISWITSFDKDYPTIHKLWIFKEVVLLYFLTAGAFFISAKSMNFAAFIPSGLVITQFILWRNHRETLKREASAYLRMNEEHQQQQV